MILRRSSASTPTGSGTQPESVIGEAQIGRRTITDCNADGYGFTPGVNEGIVKTFEAGLVTSTSCTPNFGHLDEAASIQAKFPEVSFGIHFNLNVGFPCAEPRQVRTLIGENGRFLGPALGKRLLQGKV